MKGKRRLLSIAVISLLAIVHGSLCVPNASAQDAEWFDPHWAYRRPVYISNPCGESVTNYQVQVMLDATFDFDHALPDGSDLRATDSDGFTLIPFWIEEWDPGAERASIWVKVPVIPTDGTTIYLYYGNPDPPGPEIVPVPPIGPWDKHPDNPIIPAGGPPNGDNLLAENVVYDDDTNRYWLAFANYNNSSVGLVWSDEPGDPTAWHWYAGNPVVTSANAPHLLEYNDTWYLFYADRGHGGPPYPIGVSTASAVGGPYTYVGSVLTSSESWEAYRVDEPYVFQRNGGTWILMYMGDSGSAHEQIGYAYADDILGPYTKFSGNPCLPFGPPGSYDAGTVADPWVVEFQGTYYIGYTVSPTTSHPWQTAYATTEDWQTFTKHNIILPLGGTGDWDEDNAFRGAVTRFADVYYFPYTGSSDTSPEGYLSGLATQPVLMAQLLSDPYEVFDFYDGFDGDELDLTQWVIRTYGGGGTAEVSDGTLLLTGLPGSSSGYVHIWGSELIGTGTLMEGYSRHLDAGLNPGPEETNTAGEIGYRETPGEWYDIIRVMDYPDMVYWTIQANADGNNSEYVDTSIPFDTDWHYFGIYRTVTGTVEFEIDDNPPESLGPPYVPTIDLYPWLMSYARQPAPQSRFEVDWIRIRQYCGADADVIIGSEQELSISIAKTTDTPLVPGGSDVIFDIEVTNTGDINFSSVEVSDPLAPDCEQTFPSLAAGATEFYTCTVLNVTADLDNIATVEALAGVSTYVSDTDTASVDVLPAIQVDKTADPVYLVEPGGTVDFSIYVGNTGAEEVILNELIDSIYGNLEEWPGSTCSLPQRLEAFESYACAFSAGISGSPGYSETDVVTARGVDDESNPAEDLDSATVYIIPEAYIFVDPTTLTVTEPVGTDTFDMWLTREPTDDVVIPLAPSNSQCTVSPDSITLNSTNWSSGETATVTAVDDEIDDGDQICTILTGPAVSDDPDYDQLNPLDVAVTVIDVDEAGIVVTPITLTISEPDGLDDFTILLTSKPEASVSINLSTSNDECDISSSFVVLDASNWKDGVPITVYAEDDKDFDGTQICTVQTGLSNSADDNYDNIKPDDVTVYVEDDEANTFVYLPLTLHRWPPLPAVPTLNPIDNADGDGTYTVSWTTAADAEDYVLEETTGDPTNTFTEIYIGPSTSYEVSERGATRYYYYVKARNQWGDSDPSNIQQVDVLWEKEPNDEPEEANGPIVSGLTYFGTFLDASDVSDYYYFELSANRSVEAWLTKIPSGQNYDLVIRDVSGEVVGYSGNLEDADEHITTNSLLPGRYYVQAYHRSGAGSSRPYHLRIVYK